MRRALLIGAGHAHLAVAAAAPAFGRRDVELTVVAPEAFHYSGLATGVLGGAYPPPLDVVDVAALAARGGGRFVRDRATALDVGARRADLADGPPLAWDVCSLDVGSTVDADAIPGAAAHALPVKPIANLLRLRAGLEARLRAGDRPRVVIAGAGATGCEVAANVAALARRLHGRVDVRVLARGGRVLPRLPRAASAAMAHALDAAGVVVETRTVLVAAEPGRACLDGGRMLACDHLVLATGLVPPPLARASGLPVDAAGALRVDAHLRVAGAPGVHGGGDCVAVPGPPLPRVGVHAVRQAPILLANLLAALDGAPPRRFVPQRRVLLVLNLGDGTGLLTWGRWWWRGRLAWWLKDRIDRRWLAQWHRAAAAA